MSAVPTAVESAGKATTMQALKPVNESQLPVVQMGFATLQSFELMQRAAKLLSASSLVPKDYQGNLPNCVIALNMAQRIGADPLMVMQNLYVVHGRPGWSSQFLIACFNQCGRFAAIRYRFSGTPNKDDWTCQAYSKELQTGELIEGPEISIALAKKEGWYQKSGSKWQSIPQLMLMYRAASWLVRTHAPEIAMGLQTDDEMRDAFDAQQVGNGRFAVSIDSLRQHEGDAASQPAGDADAVTAESFTMESASHALKEAGAIADLEKAWAAIALDAKTHQADIHPDIEDLYKARKAELSKL